MPCPPQPGLGRPPTGEATRTANRTPGRQAWPRSLRSPDAVTGRRGLAATAGSSAGWGGDIPSDQSSLGTVLQGRGRAKVRSVCPGCCWGGLPRDFGGLAGWAPQGLSASRARITREVDWASGAQGVTGPKYSFFLEGAVCQAPQSQSLTGPPRHPHPALLEPRGPRAGGWGHCCVP